MWERRLPSASAALGAPGRPRRSRAGLARACAAALLLAMAVLAALSACGGQHERGAALAAAGAEWSWLQDGKRRLDDLRAQLAVLGDEPEPAAQPAANASPRQGLERQIDALSRELDRRLVAYINADPPIEGTPLSPRQLAAARMKSDEEIAVAHQAILRSGDYRRAIEIYEAALGADPQNERLRLELARARDERFMTAARFSRAAPGMTADQVRDALGRPNTHDVRDYADKGVVGWFYPRDATGAAAAVWFQPRGGKLTVYLCDWNALAPLATVPSGHRQAAPGAAEP
jgi:tetratricopeptide (TPR) repeat protein